MGIDLLDILLNCENEFGARLSDEDMESLTRSAHARDIRAGDLFALICCRPICCRCKYDLRGHGTVGICPECGTAFRFDAENSDRDWRRFQEILSRVLRVKTDRISKSSLLIKDLGMSYNRRDNQEDPARSQVECIAQEAQPAERGATNHPGRGKSGKPGRLFISPNGRQHRERSIVPMENRVVRRMTTPYLASNRAGDGDA